MIKVSDHISEHTFNENGELDHQNGLPLLLDSLGIDEVIYGEIDEEIWDCVHDLHNNNSYEYLEFICNQAGFDMTGVGGNILSEIAIQVELNNRANS